jgi:hypothetical protein
MSQTVMTEPPTLGLLEAAAALGVPVRVLRHAIRLGRIPAPPGLTAVSGLSADWLERAREVVAASPTALHRTFARKVPPFARYEGTSCWRKHRHRAREYARFRAGMA